MMRKFLSWRHLVPWDPDALLLYKRGPNGSAKAPNVPGGSFQCRQPLLGSRCCCEGHVRPWPRPCHG
jgi:hypothetical protein